MNKFICVGGEKMVLSTSKQPCNLCNCSFVQLDAVPHCWDGWSCWDSWSPNQLCCSAPARPDPRSPIRVCSPPKRCSEGPEETCRPIWAAEQGGTPRALHQTSYRLGGGQRQQRQNPNTELFSGPPSFCQASLSSGWLGGSPERTLETGCAVGARGALNGGGWSRERAWSVKCMASRLII